jgi:hypothetical protein
VDISTNPGCGDDERCLHAYQDELTILPPSPSSLALVKHARDQIEAAFSPRHPQHAHGELAVTESVEILARLKPQFIHHPETKKHLQRRFSLRAPTATRAHQGELRGLQRAHLSPPLSD